MKHTILPNFPIEGANIEYKEAKNSLPSAVWDSYSAFANTTGGTIFLGIKEENEVPTEILGVNNALKIKSDFFTQQADKNKVSLSLVDNDQFEIIDIDDKQIIKITVMPALYSDKPVYIRGHQENAYRRSGHSDIRMTTSELKYHMANAYPDLDRKLLDHFNADDLNLLDLQLYRNIIAERNDDPSYADKPLNEFLQEFGIMRPDRKSKMLKLTLGGLLFFGKYQSIRDFIPNFQLDYIYRHSRKDENWIDRIVTGEIDGPENIFSFYRKVHSKIESRISDTFELSLDDTTRKNNSEKFKAVIREALVNMLSHAFYGDESTSILKQYDNFYSFYNPGALRISEEQFIHGGFPKQRNPVISLLFRRIGYSENAGSGGPRIFNNINRLALRLPKISVNDRSTELTIWNSEFTQSFQDIPKEQVKVLQLIQNNKGEIKVRQVQEELNISDYKARKLLNTMVDNGILIDEGKSSAHHYTFNLNNEYSKYALQQLVKLQEELILHD
ncbi:RNA-binding domain-containing protein [Pediococcus pentosaceus]|uniref:RNA-binding domain-containing protein n=1 Tax=Pediococcus pentosaceus TaxID=1255 RepID=UPI00398243C8